MKNKFLFFTLFIFAAFLVSCDTTSGGAINTNSEFERALREFDDIEAAPIELQEFAMNYQLLDIFYINAHRKHELGEPGEYYGKSKGTLFEKLPFSDVYYMFNQMSDLFTNYYDPSYYDELAQALFYSDEEAGFGMDYDTLNYNMMNLAIVANVYLSGPAYTAGIKVGDTLLTINDDPAYIYKVLSVEETSKKNSTSTFTLKRGEDTLTVEVEKQSFLAPSVYINYIKDIPIITITGFVDTTTLITGTYGEFKEALERTQDARATIINLAGNGGGSVDHCMPMAAELLPQGTILGYTIETNVDSSRGDYRQRIDTVVTRPEDFDITRDGIAKDRYIVFVQNSQTASCSELMISAVTTSRNAPVVGTQSYGKGIGQYYFETIAGGFSGITSSQFFDKNMDSYHSYGIQPDIINRGTKDALFKAYEIASQGTYVRTEGYSTKPSGNFAKVLARTQPQKGDIRKDFGAFKVKKAPKLIK